VASFDFDLSGIPRKPIPRNPAWEEMLARAGTYTRREIVQRWIAYAFWTSVQYTYYWVMHPWWHKRTTPSWVINRPHRAMLRWKNTRIRRGTLTFKGVHGA
jgi:hypothetical protein